MRTFCFLTVLLWEMDFVSRNTVDVSMVAVQREDKSDLSGNLLGLFIENVRCCCQDHVFTDKTACPASQLPFKID